MSETLALLDMVIEDINAIQKELKHSLDNGAFDSDIERLFIYLIGNFNTIKTETEKHREEFVNKH